MMISFSLCAAAVAALLLVVEPVVGVGNCGCSSCTSSVLDKDADGYRVRDRIDWVMANLGQSEQDACSTVCGDEFQGVCGGECDPGQCGGGGGGGSRCGCSSCTTSILGRDADGFSVDNRIDWVMANLGRSEEEACDLVCGVEYPDVCGECDCDGTPPSPTPSGGGGGGGSKCGCTSCTTSVLGRNADGHSVASRIDWVQANMGKSENDACSLVCGNEFPGICGECNPGQCSGSPTPPSPTPPSPTPPMQLKVMSYNTEYTGYTDGRFSNFAAHIANVGADLVGLQECQDSSGIAAASGYTFLSQSGGVGNTILYSNRLQAITGGQFNIPRDNFAQRTISWGKFKILQGVGGGQEFWFFNTHLPHRHGEASDPNTHANIADMLLQKRKELGAGNSPTIVTGDCNPFASAGASRGSFESNLAEGDISLVYVATGSTGGFVGLDKIFVSQEHLISKSAQDVGTGTSDHPAIAAELTLSW